jgi:glycosyltransferase involved in cell wall biosynthesis
MTRRAPILVDMAPLQAGAPTLYGEPLRLLRTLLHGWPTDADTPALHLWANGHLPFTPGLLPEGHPNLRLSYGDYPLHQSTEPDAMAYAQWWRNLLARYPHSAVHLWDPFHPAMPGLPEVDGAPLVVSLPNRPLMGLSREGRALLRRAQALCVFSATTGEALLALGVAGDRIHLLGAPIGPLCALPPHVALARRLGLTGPTILSLAEAAFLPTLLAAYAAMSDAMRARVALAVACPLSLPDLYRLEGIAEELGIYERIVWITRADEDELAALVRASGACVTSLCEDGWGMELADLAGRGATVLTRDAAGLERTDRVLRAASDDPASLTAGLQVLAERALQAEVKAVETSPVAPEEAAHALCSIYRHLPSPTDQARTARASTRIERLALVSPLPPQRTGIADFSACLMAALRQKVAVTAYVAPSERDAIRGHVEGPVEAITALPEAVLSGRLDAVLYQVGNSDYHHYMLPYLLALPGVVEIHDGVLHDLFWTLTQGQGDAEGYQRELSYAHGPEGHARAERGMAGLAEADSPLSVIRRAINASVGAIVHNAWAEQAVGAEGTGQPVLVSPLPVDLSECAGLDRAAARARLGIPLHVRVLATFGRLTPTKRIGAMLRAFAALSPSQPDARLYLVGEPDPASGVDRELALIEPLGLAGRVTVTGYVDRPTFLAYLAASDVGLNLRYPHAGETSATLTLMLNAGLPVITTAAGPFAHLPDACCWKVDPDASEEPLLVAYLQRLAADAPLRAAMGAAARAYSAAAIPTWEDAADRYLTFMAEALAGQARFLAAPRAPSDVMAWGAIPGLARPGRTPARRPRPWARP